MVDTIDGQVLYQGRWVPRKYFRAFVYNSMGQKLCESYDEFQKDISSGIWWSEPLSTNSNIEEIEKDNVVSIKAKRGRKCRSQVKA